MSRHRLLIASLTVVFCATLSFAQRSTRSLPTNTVPTPKSVLGFSPGDDRTIADWSQISDYFNRLDKASDRVQLQTIGQSTLNRTLFVAFISARENILALNKYKDIQQQLADPRKLAHPTQSSHLAHGTATTQV